MKRVGLPDVVATTDSLDPIVITTGKNTTAEFPTSKFSNPIYGDTLVWTLKLNGGALPSWLELVTTKAGQHIRYGPNESDQGDYTITFRACNRFDLCAELSTTLRVLAVCK